MSSDAVLVDVVTLSKRFQIYDAPSDRFKQFVVPRLQRTLGMQQTSYMKEFWALRDVSFQLRKGETVGIIGRNGSGKSTLLQLICGTLMPTNGNISVRGRIAALLELGAGFNPEFSGRDNVFVSASIAGISQEDMRRRFSDIEAFADIGEFIDQPVKTYSSGMFVRLAFATAIHTSPDILVVDEALAVGDTAFQTKCLTRIRELQKRGVTILLVTHSTNTLLEYCDRAIYLKKGTKVLDGACREVVKQYADDLVEEEGGIALSVRQEKSVPLAESDEIVSSTSGHTTQRIKINSVDILDVVGRQQTTFNYGEEFTIRIHVTVNDLVNLPCFGMQIKSTDDIVLWSGTSQQLERQPSAMQKGDYLLEWKCRANFSGNRYVIAIGCGDVETGEYKRHARLPYAGHIDVLPQEHAGYGWIAPDASLSWQTVEGE
ncbi:ABC transporter ATP-binding protein [Brucella intermedia]|uniref:ABC transporter ATP-binding protein n=1 Tax=Brucella intermedia TaxID=94625 RepID=UPI00165D1153|nr:ABC transporter ATP-binding protein [Brucella intermedia]QNQ41343.1 ABC transporter ATP-binding protein [Brucella intermedia]